AASSALTVRVAFPTVAEPWPDPDLFPSGFRYQVTAGRQERQWIYHLSFTRAGEEPYSSFPQVGEHHLLGLIDRFKLTGGGGIRLVANEFLRGNTDPNAYPAWAARVPPRLVGHSYELALALGTLAAFAGRALPARVLY